MQTPETTPTEASPHLTELEAEASRLAEIDKQTRAFKSGASWFFWIAGLSMVNSAIRLFEGSWSFIVGLGITQVIDEIALGGIADPGVQTSLAVRAVALGLDLVVAGFFVLCGWLALRRHTWAFFIGMALYLLDGLLFLLIQDWLSLGFHVFALVCIFGGLGALKKLQRLEATSHDLMTDPTPIG